VVLERLKMTRDKMREHLQSIATMEAEAQTELHRKNWEKLSELLSDIENDLSRVAIAIEQEIAVKLAFGDGEGSGPMC
jgi:hypothetical protein